MLAITLTLLDLPFLAHEIRNRGSRFKAVSALQAKHRWCLTGTPIQNHLGDLGALVQFLRISPFDSHHTFKTTFITPINDKNIDGLDKLQRLIQSISLRRTKKLLQSDVALPSRQETIVSVQLNDDERTLYNLVKRHFSLSLESGGSVMSIFKLTLRLRQICNHGRDLLPQTLLEWLDNASLHQKAKIPRVQTCENCEAVIDDDLESTDNILACCHVICQACLQVGDNHNKNGHGICPLCVPDPTKSITQFNKMPTHPKVGSTVCKPSSKVKALLKALQDDYKEAKKAGLTPEKR